MYVCSYSTDTVTLLRLEDVFSRRSGYIFAYNQGVRTTPARFKIFNDLGVIPLLVWALNNVLSQKYPVEYVEECYMWQRYSMVTKESVGNIQRKHHQQLSWTIGNWYLSVKNDNRHYETHMVGKLSQISNTYSALHHQEIRDTPIFPVSDDKSLAECCRIILHYNSIEDPIQQPP
jgi:hypothetical protein